MNVRDVLVFEDEDGLLHVDVSSETAGGGGGPISPRACAPPLIEPNLLPGRLPPSVGLPESVEGRNFAPFDHVSSKSAELTGAPSCVGVEKPEPRRLGPPSMESPPP